MTRGAAALVVAGVVLAGGVTAATAAGNTESHHAGTAVSNIEHFSLMTTNPNNTAAEALVATGVFTAGGIDRPIRNNLDKFVFSNGSFEIKLAGQPSQTLNPKTCLGKVTQSGSYTLAGGRGTYAGIAGHGTYQAQIIGVAPRKANGTCNGNATPEGFQLIVRAHGPISGVR